MKKYSLLVLAVLLAAGLGTGSLAALNAGSTQPAGRPALTQDQIAKMKADRDTFRAARATQSSQLKTLTDQLQAELKKKPVDKNKVGDLSKQIDIQRNAMQIQQMQMMMGQQSNLSPEQQKKYNDMIQRMKDRQAKRQTAK